MSKYTVLRPFGDLTHEHVGTLLDVPDTRRANIMIDQRLIRIPHPDELKPQKKVNNDKSK